VNEYIVCLLLRLWLTNVKTKQTSLFGKINRSSITITIRIVKLLILLLSLMVILRESTTTSKSAMIKRRQDVMVVILLIVLEVMIAFFSILGTASFESFKQDLCALEMTS
jgi:hypothetical protein